MPIFATPGPVNATVEVAGARVRVTASDRTDTVVLVEPINEASRSDVKVADKAKVDFTDGQLSRRTTRSWFTPARGTATSSFNAQQADRQEASVTSTSSDQLVCVPSRVTSANRASPR
jgi:hypothetical protein